jgi:hypothetical protein
MKNYSDAIWFANGFIWQMISMAQVASANSFTFNHAIFDECRFAKKQKIYEELMPAISGQTHPFGDTAFTREGNPFYCGTYFVSDAALTLKQSWLEQEEDKLKDHPSLGPFTDMTYQQIQDELEAFGRDVIKYNDLLYNAKKEKRQMVEVTPEKKAEIEALYEAVTKREGPYKIIPRQYGADTKGACDSLVSYKLISADDAELLTVGDGVVVDVHLFEHADLLFEAHNNPLLFPILSSGCIVAHSAPDCKVGARFAFYL